jgi:hypothetical protein
VLVHSATVERIPNPNTVSPGFAGFMFMFLLAVATVLLIRSMVKHMRKVRYLPDPHDLDYLDALDEQSGPNQAQLQRTGNVVDDQRIDTRRE